MSAWLADIRTWEHTGCTWRKCTNVLEGVEMHISFSFQYKMHILQPPAPSSPPHRHNLQCKMHKRTWRRELRCTKCTMCIMCIAHPICFPSTFCQIRGVRDTSVDALTLLNCSSVILRLTCALPWTAQIRSWRTTLCFVLQYFEWHDSTKCVAFLQIMSDARPSVTVALPQIVAQLCRKWKTWATSLATDWAVSIQCSSCRGELFSLSG